MFCNNIECSSAALAGLPGAPGKLWCQFLLQTCRHISVVVCVESAKLNDYAVPSSHSARWSVISVFSPASSPLSSRGGARLCSVLGVRLPSRRLMARACAQKNGGEGGQALDGLRSLARSANQMIQITVPRGAHQTCTGSVGWMSHLAIPLLGPGGCVELGSYAATFSSLLRVQK